MTIITRFKRLMKIPRAAVLLAAALILSGFTAQAEYLIVNFTNGSVTSFDLNDRPDVTFEDQQLLIKSADVEASYAVADVEKFTFGDKQDALDPVLGENETRLVYRDRNSVEVRGLGEGVTVDLYNIAGMKVMSTAADNGAASFDLSQLAHGVYILSTSTGQTFKISK